MPSQDFHAPAPSDAVEVIFLGTGTSACLPHVDCLTAPPGSKPCRTCLATLQPEGKKNIRRNTSVAIKVRGRDGELRTIIIDVGKSFQAAAVEWFPKHGLRRIDAVLITHAHADAMNGLDDLRGWTLHNAIQPHVDLYVSLSTFKEVQRAFPYLVAKEFASGGGDVPEFKWHIIEDRVPFEIGDTGIRVNPFAVHHGRVFSVAPPVEFVPSPNSISPSSTNPPSPTLLPVRSNGPIHPIGPATKQVHPYFCLGFVIEDTVTYISDASHIPDDVWAIFETTPDRNVPPVFILDCLRPEPHTSHFGISESLAVARRMNAQRTYWLGFSHELSHDEYVIIGEAVGGRTAPKTALRPAALMALDKVDASDPIWLRPAFDGLKISISQDGDVKDEEYH